MVSLGELQMENHILLAWVRPLGHYSQSVLKGHTISSSISLIFCTVVMVVPSNKAENKAALLTLPISASRRSLSFRCSKDEDGDTFTLSLAFSLDQPCLALSFGLSFAGPTLQASPSRPQQNKPTVFPISPWVARKVQNGSEKPSQTTKYVQRLAPDRPGQPLLNSLTSSTLATTTPKPLGSGCSMYSITYGFPTVAERCGDLGIYGSTSSLSSHSLFISQIFIPPQPC